MARSRPKQSPNQDLVDAAKYYLPEILVCYKQSERHRPVMLLDLESEKIYAYPYEEYKATLSERSQAMLTDEYERAIVANKIVVFVRDSETRRLTSMSFKNE